MGRWGSKDLREHSSKLEVSPRLTLTVLTWANSSSPPSSFRIVLTKTTHSKRHRKSFFLSINFTTLPLVLWERRNPVPKLLSNDPQLCVFSACHEKWNLRVDLTCRRLCRWETFARPPAFPAFTILPPLQYNRNLLHKAHGNFQVFVNFVRRRNESNTGVVKLRFMKLLRPKYIIVISVLPR